MDTAHKSIGLVMLAAGASVRMNEPKQLLIFEGKTLLRRAAETVVESIYQPQIVVLGANFERTNAEIEDLPIEIVFNENWSSGLSSSLRAGLENLLKISPDIAACVIALADQPLITAKHLNLFAERFYQTNNSIIAAEYNEIHGVPVLFSREIFDELCGLSGDQGAKRLIKKHRENLASINMPEAAFDIDTPPDFAKLKQ